MHASVYEVRKKTNNEDDPEAVPVYSTYVTSDNDPTSHEIYDIVAVLKAYKSSSRQLVSRCR